MSNMRWLHTSLSTRSDFSFNQILHAGALSDSAPQVGELEPEKESDHPSNLYTNVPEEADDDAIVADATLTQDAALKELDDMAKPDAITEPKKVCTPDKIQIGYHHIGFLCLLTVSLFLLHLSLGLSSFH